MADAGTTLADSSENARLLRGLQFLGLRRDSDRSVLHLWARQLPAGMFDGHRSAMVAPDHLIYHGLTKRLVIATFKMLSVDDRCRVGTSLREALAHCHYPVTAVYNAKRNAITSLGISEWAATLSVFPMVLRRTLQGASHAPGQTLTTLHRVMRIIDSFTLLVRITYFSPRVDLDGITACRERASAAELQRLAEVFFSGVQAACLRDDMSSFGFYLDVPNLHRLRELIDHVIPALLHIRHAQELLFENAHQLLKRAVVSGNGHDDAARSMTRYVQTELIARIRTDHSLFSIPDDWMGHAGIKTCLTRAKRLSAVPGGQWRCSGASLATSDLPAAATELADVRCGTSSAVKWRSRATRGDVARMRIGDAVRVLTCAGPVGIAVHVATGPAARRSDTRPAYFRVIAFFTTRSGNAAAAVHPLKLAQEGTHWTVDESRCLYLPLVHARRSLVLHDCAGLCDESSAVVQHTTSNRWQVLGREHGFPARSG